ADGINIVASAMLTSFRQQLGELSLAAKLPAVCQWRSMVEAGCLASYGIKLADLYAISANQVAKVLSGGPGERYSASITLPLTSNGPGAPSPTWINTAGWKFSAPL